MIKLDLKKIIGYFIYRNDRFAAIKLWRDWRVMILGFFVLLTVVFLISGYLFWKIKIDSSLGGIDDLANGNGKVLTLKKQSLDRVAKELKEKEKIFNDFLSSSSTPFIRDPSI